MTQALPKILEHLAETLRSDIGPALEGHYSGGNANMIALMLDMAGAECEAAVDCLVREISQLRQLFETAVERGLPDGLAASLSGELARNPFESYRLSVLEGVLDRMLAHLIDLHVWSESADTAAHAETETAILDFLVTQAAERMPQLPDMSPPED